MELKISVPGKADAKNTLKVSDEVFGQKFNSALVHQVVTACRAAARQGSKKQKTRAEVSGGGAKPWRQKGTGRARAGTSRSPIWRSGGVTFAARPRQFDQKVNKKMYHGAVRSILSELARQDRLIIVEDFAVMAPKTRELIAKLADYNLKEALLVVNSTDENLQLAARNLSKVYICQPNEISLVDLIGFEKVLMTVPAVKRFEEWLG